MPDKHDDRNEIRLHTFSLRVNATERAMLKELARKLQRSRSEVVRLLVREALQGLNRMQEQDLATSEAVLVANSAAEEVSDEPR